MNRGLALALVLLVSIPSPALGQPEEKALPGDYPDEVRALADELLAAAEEDAWPAEPSTPEAEEQLEEAEAALDRGRVSEALERYVTFRIEHAHGHLVEELSEVSASQGREILSNVTERFLVDGQATVEASRTLVNGLDPANLSLRGAETGLWGAYWVGQGEFHLSRHAELPIRSIFNDDRLQEAALRAHLALAVGGATEVTVGAAIVGLAQHVDGPAAEDPVILDRLETVAALEAGASEATRNLQHLPRANVTEDNAVLRAGLVLTAMRELHGQEALRILKANPGEQPARFLAEGLASDQERLLPWATAGSPLALAALEQTDVELGPDSSESQISRLTRVRAFAQAVIESEEIISPETAEAEEENASPVPWLPAVAVALVGAALVRARRRG